MTRDSKHGSHCSENKAINKDDEDEDDDGGVIVMKMMMMMMGDSCGGRSHPG